MFRIKEVLSGTIKSLGITKQYNAQSVIVHWPEIVGEDISSHAWPISTQRGILLLAVNNSVWSHHLLVLKPEIINKINTFLNEKLIVDIRFQAGDLRKYQNHQEGEEFDSLLYPEKLGSEELADVWKATEAIQDPNLRKKCYYVLIKQTGMNKAKQNQGWQPCKRCSVLVPPRQRYCTVCSRDQQREKKEAIKKLLVEAPWFTYQEVNQFIPCSPRDFHNVKKRLIHKYIHALFESGWDKLNDAVLVMLMTGVKPDKINQAMVDTVIGKIKVRLAEKVRRKNNVLASRR